MEHLRERIQLYFVLWYVLLWMLLSMALEEANVFQMTSTSNNSTWVLLHWSYVYAHHAEGSLYSVCSWAWGFLVLHPWESWKFNQSQKFLRWSEIFHLYPHSEVLEFLNWCSFSFLNFIFKCSKQQCFCIPFERQCHCPG